MGTKKTRLLITLIILTMALVGMILGFIMKEANVVITSLGTASATGIAYIGGKSLNNNIQLKNNQNG